MESRYQAFVLILASSLLILIIFLTFPLKPKNDPLPQIADNEWTLIATGDVMLGRTVMSTSLQKNDVFYPWRNVADRLKAADITFVNLENPIVENCPIHLDGFKFCASPGMAMGLKYAGVDIVTLANNHSGNYGNKGLVETVSILHENKIKSTRLTLETVEVKGVKVGFIGIDLVDRKELTPSEISLISNSKKQVDYLIVAPHWGYEYQATSSKYQKAMAQEIIANGGDLIIGSHPHWVQERGEINGKPVYYSLGNFIFDQPWSQETKKGLAIKFTFKGKDLQKEERMPIFMQNLGQPQWQ